MNYYNNNINWRNVSTLILLVIVTTIIIVVSLPHKGGMHLSYTYNQPWKQGPLIAKYTFPVIRHADSIQRDKNQCIAEFKPYYVIDDNVETKAVEEFNKAFNDSTAGDLIVFKEHIIQRLRFIYPKGIMSPEDYIKYAPDSSKEIRIIEDPKIKEAKSVGIRRILTPKTAYELMFFDEELKENKNRLNQLHINDYIKPNLTYNVQRSQHELDSIIDHGVAKVKGEVMAGEKIVDTGDMITQEILLKLQSLDKQEQANNYDKKTIRNKIIGQSIIVLMLVILFTCYLVIFRNNYFDNLRNIMMLYAMIIIFPLLTSAIAALDVDNLYIIPFSMVPMLTRVFLDSRTAFITHITIILISSLAINISYEFILIETVAGLTAIYTLNDMSKRAHLFKAAFMVVLCSAIMYYATQLIQNDTLIPTDRGIYWRFFFGSVLLLLAYPLMWTIEKVFGFVSVVTLYELSDSSRGLLRKLSEIAPGTFQHSTTVGNLAYEIANKIGANGLLVRTGALYHDIGKMSNPVFFTENQASVNPHNQLSEKESAQIIISHVTEGQKLAEKYNLPDVIKNFILTHHGHGTAKYFYIKYKNAHPDEEVDINAFSYPGPNPFTREQAILMMADSVEAASRSLTEYNDDTIRNLVDKIIDSQVNDGYFNVCPITFLDIATAKQVLNERLVNIYHTRIQYPELKKETTVQPTEENTDSQSKNRGKRGRLKFKR